MRTLGLIAAVFISALFSALSAAAETTTHDTTWQGSEREYVVHVPRSIDGSTPRPLLVLLHGSGRNGEVMIKQWRKLADKEEVILVAPDSLDPRSWQGPHDGPGFLHKVVEEVREVHPVDGSRIYLFGHSGGGHFALFMGLMESEYFAAVAAHAGMIPAGNESFVRFATRKTPFAMWVGDRDRVVLQSDVERTADLFENNEFPTEISVMRRHDHNYYAKAKKVNAEAWSFLSGYSLDGEPRYVDHGDRDEAAQ